MQHPPQQVQSLPRRGSKASFYDPPRVTACSVSHLRANAQNGAPDDMKLRLQGNSVRLRLTQPEVMRLRETVEFAGDRRPDLQAAARRSDGPVERSCQAL